MATTTNYGWTTPDDTDLVKDGAAAIRTLGSAVDTTTKNLNPSTTLGDIEYRSATANTNTRLGIGSTGQVLTVAGGVPTWATSDDANAIQNAIVDAKGDIVAASAADTPARLAVGTDNQRLVAASGEATGLKYVSDSQNTVIDAEGDLLIGDADNALQRLAIGTTGQILTVDTTIDGKIKWAAPAAGGGMTLINSGGTALSGSSVTIGSIPGTYNMLILKIENYRGVSDGTTVRIRFNGDSGANRYRTIDIGNTSANVAFTVTSGDLGSNQDSVATSTAFSYTTIPNYASATQWKMAQCFNIGNWYLDATEVVIGNSTIVYNQTTAITSIDLFPNSGNFSTGTAYLYGVN